MDYTDVAVSSAEDSIREIYQGWLSNLVNSRWLTSNNITSEECEHLGIELITGFMASVINKGLVTNLLKTLTDISRRGAQAGLTPSETSIFVMSLRPYLSKICGNNSNVEEAHFLLEQAALYTFEVFAESREQLIIQQQQDMLELSTPIIELWGGILAIPIVGTVDSKRTQQITEHLLNYIVEKKVSVAIFDITGVTMVDTLVANHIIKTASAVKLLGATMIITGISPEVAQTIVHLGIDLSGVVTRAIMADGLELAFQIIGKKVISV